MNSANTKIQTQNLGSPPVTTAYLKSECHRLNTEQVFPLNKKTMQKYHWHGKENSFHVTPVAHSIWDLQMGTLYHDGGDEADR